MPDYVVIALLDFLQNFVGPILGVGSIFFFLYKVWKVWVQNKSRKIEKKNVELLLKRIEHLEEKLNGLKIEDRVQVLEEIVVSEELKK